MEISVNILSRLVPKLSEERMASLNKVASAATWTLLSVTLLLSIWTLAAYYIKNPVLLPMPIEVGRGFLTLISDSSLSNDILASLKRVFIGFFIASAIAVPLAMALAHNEYVRRLVMPDINLIRPIPPIAWIPIGILWFGIGDETSYFITAIAAFFPIFLNSFAGGMAMERQHLYAAKCLGAKRIDIIRHVMLPSALPMIWTGLKIGLGQSWMAVVTAELVAAQSGLGYMIQVNRLNLDTAYVLVGMAVIGVLGSVMTHMLSWAERFVLPWRNA
jgi:ABC-type nitrate/sulfonate/bicarbonate transport system permease component